MDIVEAKLSRRLRGRGERGATVHWISRTSPAFAATLLALVLHFLRFGYAYGSGDQDELLPLVIHRLDNALFANDWFIMSQSDGIGVRTYAVGLLTYLSQLMPLWASVLVVHLASWFLVGMAVYFLAIRFTRSRVTGMATVLIVLVLTPQWTLGGNDIIHSAFVPSSLAWGLALTGLLMHLRERSAAAGALIGIASLFQALVGIHLMLLVAWDLLLRLRPRNFRRRWMPTLFALITYAIVSAPILVPLILKQMDPDGAVTGGPSPFYVAAEFRNPHHYLPLSFSLESWLKFAALATVGGFGLYVLEQRRMLGRPKFVRRAALLLVLAMVIGFVGSETLHLLTVAKLQLFMFTVPWKILFVAGAVGAAIQLWPALGRIVNPMEKRPGRAAGALIVLAVLCSTIIATSDSVLKKRIGPLAHRNSGLGLLEAWVRRSTPQDAVFLVPPSITTFRPHAQRAIVVDFKAFPFEPALSRAWFDRLMSVAPMRLPTRGGAQILSDLDRAFSQQPVERLVDLMERYEADYVLLPSEVRPGDELQQVYRGGEWHLYRLNPAGTPRLAKQWMATYSAGEASA